MARKMRDQTGTCLHCQLQLVLGLCIGYTIKCLANTVGVVVYIGVGDLVYLHKLLVGRYMGLSQGNTTRNLEC